MEEQDLDVFNEMSNDGSGSSSGSSQGALVADDKIVHLPAYLAYICLGFKTILTLIIVLMAGWVIITIKTTKSLHKTHNIFVAYVMGIDAVFAFTSSVLSGAMIISYFTDLGDFIGCNVFMFMLYPTGIIFFTFLVMSLDKVIAITYPFKHRQIMKPRVVCGIIVVKHILAVLIYIRDLFAPHCFTMVAQFGTCTRKDPDLKTLITIKIRVYSTCLITIFLDVYLTIKAYQIRKQIQEESKLSGGHSNDVKTLKKKEANIRKHLKPAITLLVVVMGNSFIGLLFPVLFISAAFLESPTVYESVVRYIIAPNIGLVTLLLHPFAYALYFKEVREPMMRLLKRITCPCKHKSGAVAPQPQNRITWLNVQQR